jgi:branched-chain amino acid transport system substrate-binding protein
MIPTSKILAAAGLVCGWLALASSAPAFSADVPGVTDREIKIGNTAPYSGPASAYGTVSRAIDAYFKMVNAQGGINGRKINFISYDDGYSPPKTVEQIRRLVEQDEVAFIFSSTGTAPNAAIWEYMNAKKVPQLFLGSGAAKWGDPNGHPWSMGWTPAYQIEGKIYAHYILKNVPDPKVGILFQNDDLGKDYVIGLKAGLGAKAAQMIVKEGSYEVTDPTIDSQIVALKDSGANVFFNVTTPKFAAQAIRKVSEIGWKPVHILDFISSSVAAVLTPAGLDKSQGILSANYLKDPTDPQWQNEGEVKAWRKWMAEYYPEGNTADQGNTYAYAVAYTLHQVLIKCGDDLSRENIMKQAADIKDLAVPMLLPGVKVNTSPDDFYPIEQLQMSRFDGTHWVLFGELIDGRSVR